MPSCNANTNVMVAMVQAAVKEDLHMAMEPTLHITHNHCQQENHCRGPLIYSATSRWLSVATLMVIAHSITTMPGKIVMATPTVPTTVPISSSSALLLVIPKASHITKVIVEIVTHSLIAGMLHLQLLLLLISPATVLTPMS